MNNKALQGQTLLLLGASGGIGSALAKQVTAQGAELIIAGRNLRSLQQLAIQLPTKTQCIEADLSEQSGRELLMLALPNQIDGVIFATGTNDFTLFEQQDPRSIRQLFEVNTLLPMLLTRDLLTRLKAKARLIYVGSTLGAIGYPGYAAYGATKAALKHFVQALRREMADSCLQFCYIAPRSTQTSMNSQAAQELNRVLGSKTDQPDWVAAQILQQLMAKRMHDQNLGMPERLFVRLNAWFPKILDLALHKQLSVIKQYVRRTPAEPHSGVPNSSEYPAITPKPNTHTPNIQTPNTQTANAMASTSLEAITINALGVKGVCK